MDIRTSIKQLLALTAFVSAASLTACGGGGGGSSIPSAGHPAATGKVGQTFTAFIPKGTGTSSGARHTQYIDSSGTSSLLVTVTPGDPAELAQFGTFSVCYNLFTNGVATPSTGVTITPVVGPPAGFNVSFSFPAPPGQDNFVLTQYAGACSAANPYVAPTPGPGQSASNLIISQSNVLTVYINAGTSNGAANGFNVQLWNCTPAPTGGAPAGSGTTAPCPVPNPGVGALTPTLGATVASVYLGGASPAPNPLGAPVPLPIVGPIREQGAFVAAANNVGLPIPVVGLDANGFAVPYTAGVPGTNPPSSGLLPKAPLNPACSAACTDAITVSHTEADVAGGPHGKLYMIDAATGAVVQVEGAGAPITLTALNGIDTTDIAYGGAHGGGGGVANDPYVIVLVTDGTAATQVTSYTISLGGQFNGAALTAQTRTINPQATIFSTAAVAPGNGYADPAGPYTAAADAINTNGLATGAGQGIWVSDAGNLHEVGVANHAVAGATTLTGMTVDTFTGSAPAIPPQILAVDNAVATACAPATTPCNAGVYVFDPLAFTNKPLAVQNATTGFYTSFANPVGIAYKSGGYAYVAQKNGTITAIDPQASVGAPPPGLATTGGGAFYQAEQIGTISIATGSTAPNFGTATGVDMLFSGSKLMFADPGNNRIASIDLSTCGPPSVTACVVTAFATGHPFVGVSANGTGFVASDTAGQLYSITSAGVVTSFGVTTGAVADGPIGVLTPPATGAAPYLVQGNTGNFFGSASTPTLPYNILPFSATGPVLAGAAQAAVVGAPLKLAADTSNGTITATTPGSVKAPFGIVFVSAAQATNNSLTKDSYLFTDLGNVRTLVP